MSVNYFEVVPIEEVDQDEDGQEDEKQEQDENFGIQENDQNSDDEVDIGGEGVNGDEASVLEIDCLQW